MRKKIFATAALLLLHSAAAAEIFRWVDADGNVHFGDRPPENAKTEQIAAAAPPSPDAQAKAQVQVDALQRADVKLAERIERDVARRERQRAAKLESRKIHCDLAKRDYQAARTRLKSGGYVDESKDIIEKTALDHARAKVKQACG